MGAKLKGKAATSRLYRLFAWRRRRGLTAEVNSKMLERAAIAIGRGGLSVIKQIPGLEPWAEEIWGLLCPQQDQDGVTIPKTRRPSIVLSRAEDIARLVMAGVTTEQAAKAFGFSVNQVDRALGRLVESEHDLAGPLAASLVTPTLLAELAPLLEVEPHSRLHSLREQVGNEWTYAQIRSARRILRKMSQTPS